MPLPFYSLPVTSFDSGEWLHATISDDGTPLGDSFPVGSPVHVRQAIGDEYWLLLPGAKPLRRFLTGTQVVVFTEGTYPPCDDQDGLTALWKSLDPPHGGYLEPGVPRFYRYKRIEITDTTPITSEKDWEADWDRHMIYLEKRALHPPKPLDPDEHVQYVQDCLAHESCEHDQSYDGKDGACDRFPNASPEDLDKVAEELQGLMHARTIGMVEEYVGAGAELLYYLAYKQLLIKMGYENDVQDWAAVTI